MKRKLIFLFSCLFVFFSCSSVFADTYSETIPLQNAKTFYDSENVVPGAGVPTSYYSFQESVIASTISTRLFIPHLEYNHNNNTYDASFTDLKSNNNVFLNPNGDLLNTGGYNGAFTLEIGLTFGCKVGSSYCGLGQQTQIPLNDTTYYGTIDNLDYANYLLNNIYILYKDIDGRTHQAKLNLVTTNAYWLVTDYGFTLKTSNFSASTLVFEATITDRSFYEFLAIRFTYDPTIIDWISPNSDRNTVQVTTNNALACNYNDGDYGTAPPMPDLDDTPNSEDMLNSDVNIQRQDNFITILGNKIATNNTISSLLLMPITLFQNVLSTLNGNTCNPFPLGSLFGTNLTLPCINLQFYLGSNLFQVIDIICSGLFVLIIRKKFVDVFNNMTNLRDRGNEVE